MPALPPLKSLQAFEAAARYKSFKEAARELHVTPAAISQQIRSLEVLIGQPLFQRGARSVALTETGALAAPALHDAFRRLSVAVDLLRAPVSSRILTVSVAPSFCARWLVPRLHRFRAVNPDIDLRLDATDANARLSGDGIDVAIRYGRGRYAGLRSVLLKEDSFVPVCAPRFLEATGEIRKPEDIAGRMLIHLEWSYERAASPNWAAWFAAAGAGQVDVARGLRFSADSMALQAAIDGQGVALASRLLADDDIRAGRLERLLPDTPDWPAAFALYLVSPPDGLDDSRVGALLDWLRKELGTEVFS